MIRTKSTRSTSMNAWAPIVAELQDLCAIAAEERRKIRAMRADVGTLHKQTRAMLAWVQSDHFSNQIRELRLSGRMPPAPVPAAVMAD
jgi:hypothetical protein